MTKNQVIMQISKAVQVGKEYESFLQDLIPAFGEVEIPKLEEMCYHTMEILWEIIQDHRDFPEITEDEFDLFKEIYWDLVFMDNYTNKHNLDINTPEEFYDYFVNHVAADYDYDPKNKKFFPL